MMQGMVHGVDDRTGTEEEAGLEKGVSHKVEHPRTEGADPHRPDADGETPLYWAATLGRLFAVKVLLSLGADPSVRRKKDGKCAKDKVEELLPRERVLDLVHRVAGLDLAVPDDDLAVGHAGHKPIHPQYLAKVVSDAAADDAVFTCDVGTPTIWAARYLKLNGRRRLVGSFAHGSMAGAMRSGCSFRVG